jgi:hypothetical protein
MHPHRWLQGYQISLLACLLGLVPTAVHAQAPPISSATSEHRLWGTLGWEHTWALALGYSRGLPGLLGGQDARLELSTLLPVVLLPRAGGARLSVGLSTLLHPAGRFSLHAGASSGMALANDPTGRKLALHLGLFAQPGYQGGRGSVALDLGWMGALATYLWHSDLVRDTFEDRYPEGGNASSATRGPSNGWSFLTASRLRLGAVGGYPLSHSVALFGGGGFEYTPNELGRISAPAFGLLPFYLRLGGTYQW